MLHKLPAAKQKENSTITSAAWPSKAPFDVGGGDKKQLGPPAKPMRKKEHHVMSINIQR